MTVAEKDIETLVLDDDHRDMKMLHDRIAELGLEKISLVTTIKGLKEKLNPNVRVLVVDIRLSDIDVDDEGKFIENGADVMRYARQRNPGIYVIAISGQVTEEIFIQLINNKVDWFIKKKMGQGFIDELIEQIKIGREAVALRDAILEHAIQSNIRIENRRKLRENDTGAMD